MGTLSTLWPLVRNLSERHDLAIYAAQLDNLATALGETRPAAVTSPQAIADLAPASIIEAWESWYNAGPVTAHNLPPTTLLNTTPPTDDPASWSSLVALAATRNVPEAVRAYLGVQNSSWQVAREHWTDDATAGEVFTGFERAVRAWWFTRLGGVGGTATTFSPGAAGSGSSGSGMGDGMKFGLAALAAYLLSKYKKRR